ncbi:hypothetical protein HDU87_004061 [Geranomyces variabilis]|uniref:Uncharacterized protein n=1 Tax=Geranomyces variabilis TaxID=109894 RepID=A0AAD5TRL1_9FUNG|nr:hypothetical protein HDU87_004061 [Geranomyces variabilis]
MAVDADEEEEVTRCACGINDAKSTNGGGRNTMNSRETAQAFAEDLKPAHIEILESAIDDERRSSQESNGTTAMGREMRRASGDPAFGRKNSADSHSPEADTKPAKRKRAAASPQAKVNPVPEVGRSSKRRAGRNHEPLDTTTTTTTTTAAATTDANESKSPIREDIKHINLPSLQAPSKTRKRRATGSGTRKSSNTSSRTAAAAANTTTTAISPSSTTGIPDTVHVLVPNAAAAAASPSSSSNHNHNHNDTAVKTRVPNAKSSFGEMNKRVKQMSDYITHLQVAMANYPSFLATAAAGAAAGAGVGSAAAAALSADSNGGGGGGGANAHSVSPVSASTQSPAGSEPPQSSSSSFYNAATSPAAASVRPQMFEMMDHLNLRLIRFQERYGSFSKR